MEFFWKNNDGMKLLYRALGVGAGVAAFNYFLIVTGLQFWGTASLSTAGLIAGIFFIMAMIFQSALQDNKRNDIHITNLRGTIASINDLNIAVARRAKGAYDPMPFGRKLVELLKDVRLYIENKQSFLDIQSSIHSLCYSSEELRKHLTEPEGAFLHSEQQAVRSHVSYLSYAKALHFPRVGYIFLDFFIIVLLAMHLFAQVDNVFLEMLFIFTLSSTLTFFSELIHDLDKPFSSRCPSFQSDTKPLTNGMKALSADLMRYEKAKAERIIPLDTATLSADAA